MEPLSFVRSSSSVLPRCNFTRRGFRPLATRLPTFRCLRRVLMSGTACLPIHTVSLFASFADFLCVLAVHHAYVLDGLVLARYFDPFLNVVFVVVSVTYYDPLAYKTLRTGACCVKSYLRLGFLIALGFCFVLVLINRRKPSNLFCSMSAAIRIYRAVPCSLQDVHLRPSDGSLPS